MRPQWLIGAARQRLSGFVERRVSDIRYIGVPAHLAPNSYQELVDMHTRYDVVWHGTAPFTVSSDNCDNIIYTSPHTNMLARVWHDMLHLEHGLDFSSSDEVRVGMLQVKEVEEAFGRGSLESLLILADTVGQTLYYMQQGEFPANQLEFVNSYLEKGL